MPITITRGLVLSLLLATGCGELSPTPEDDEPELATEESELATCMATGDVKAVIDQIAANCGGVSGCIGTNTTTHADFRLSNNNYCACYDWLWSKRNVAPFKNVQIFYHNAAANQCGTLYHLHVEKKSSGTCNGMGGLWHMDLDTTSQDVVSGGVACIGGGDIDRVYRADCTTTTDSRKAGACVDPGGGTGGDMHNGTPGGTNLERTASCSTDSMYGAGWDCSRAKDGVITQASKWTSTDVKAKHWLVYDLGSPRVVNGYIVYHAGAAGELQDFNTVSFKIQRGDSASGPWHDETVVTGPANVTTRTYYTPKILRYVRLRIVDAGIDNFARIPEFQVRGQ